MFENLIILGSSTNQAYDSAPGDIRAYDVRSGALVWTFHTIPHAGEFGYDTWPKDAWKTVGGANAWGEMSVDKKRGIVYIPTASPKYNFYGGDRKGANLFGDCLLALDARTGKRIWHFQMVHHDIWDYDNATAPKLLTIRHNGKMVDVVAQAGKTGWLYVFNRDTGESLWPIEERPVPRSDMPGEETWPTQPYPVAPPPFARQTFTEKDLNPYIDDPAEMARFRDQMKNAHNEGMFTPPGFDNTLQSAGNNGGANWGNAAVDPITNTLYVQSKNAPAILKLEAKRPKMEIKGSPETKGQIIYLQNCQSCHTPQLTGQPPAVPSLVDIVSRVGADRIRSIVTNGSSPMPAFPDLSSTDLDSLISYLRTPGASRIPADVVAYLSAPPLPPSPSASDGSDTVRYWSGYGFMTANDGLSAVKPPWSTLTAYDLNQRTIKWQIPLGEVAELEAKGINDTGGYFPEGGPAVTAGGLIFSGTESDFKMRAYDKDTGKVLWEQELPAAPHAEVAVYEVDGREYVVQARAAEAAGSEL